MRILAIEASGPVAGCALLEDGTLTAEYSVQYKKKHSQSLVPMLDEMKGMVDLDLSGIDFIAVTSGPGSFTGLRIGAATVKGLGLALDKPVLPVPTVDSLACNLFGTDRLICPLMDARRQQVYTGIYENREELKVLRPQCVVALSEIVEELNKLGREVVFLGDGVPVFRKTIEGTCKVPFSFAPPQSALQRAASVAALGERYAMMQKEREGKSEDRGSVRCMISADDFKPIYLRKSQAEREHEAAAKARQAQDLADVAAMEQEMFSDAWSLETLTDTIRYSYNHILLISTEGDIRPLVSEEDVADSFVVGEEEQKTAGYLIYADPSDEAELHRIAILPEYRRHGLARKLMAELLLRTGHVSVEDSQVPNAKPLFLEVRAGNTAAIALYLANHFQEIDRRKNYYHNPDEDAVVMRLYASDFCCISQPES